MLTEAESTKNSKRHEKRSPFRLRDRLSILTSTIDSLFCEWDQSPSSVISDYDFHKTGIYMVQGTMGGLTSDLSDLFFQISLTRKRVLEWTKRNPDTFTDISKDPFICPSCIERTEIKEPFFSFSSKESKDEKSTWQKWEDKEWVIRIHQSGQTNDCNRQIFIKIKDDKQQYHVGGTAHSHDYVCPRCSYWKRKLSSSKEAEDRKKTEETFH